MTELLSDPAPDGRVTWSPGGDTVRMPWSPEGAIPDTVVRPALAVLFRMAVGPGADYYVPRFLAREAQPRAAPGWVWPAFLFPTGWAFYRKRWLIGAGFAMLQFAGLGAFLALERDLGGGEIAWWLTLFALAVVVPGIVAALLALPLLHGAVRRSVRKAEAIGDRPDRVAALLAAENPTSMLNALLLGFAAVTMWLAVALPPLESRHDERLVRSRVAASLAAVAPLQSAIADSRQRAAALPKLDGNPALAPTPPGDTWIASVTLGPGNGRLRLTFADVLDPLGGKSLLLAPAVDEAGRVQWVCVPVDIPRQLVPRECRTR